MATDREIYKSWLRGALGSTGMSDPKALVEKANQRSFIFRTIADGAANTDQSYPVWVLDRAAKIVSVKVTFDSTVNAAAANGKNLTLEWDDAAGGSDTVAASGTTLSGGLGTFTAFVPKTLTKTDAQVEQAAGRQLIWKSTTLSAGVQLPTGTVQVTLEDI